MSSNFEQIWQARYGTKPPEEICPFEWALKHRSVREYSNKPIPETTIQQLVLAAQSAATSSFLQTWSVISVQDPLKRDELMKIGAGNQQIKDTPWFFVFLADLNRIKQAAYHARENPDGLDYTEFFVMSIIDTSLAAERMACAAESMGLGICYIGALRNDVEAIRKLLKLPKKIFPVFGLCLGWPKEDKNIPLKPRLAQQEVWFKEEYPSQINIMEFDERMRKYYKSQSQNPDITWSQRSGKRAGLISLTGRENLKKWLEDQELGLK